MKLISLQLGEPFRSLPEGFRINFLRECDEDKRFLFSAYCLAGRNGSGKSNVLEALAAIFYHLEVMHLNYLPDGFAVGENNPRGWMASVCDPDVFELEYLIEDKDLIPREIVRQFSKGEGSSARLIGRQLVRIRVVKAKGASPEMLWLNRGDYEEFTPERLTSLEAKRYLPRYVLGYSSGHNEVLSLPFQKMRFIHFDEYRHYLRLSMTYQRPEGRLLYSDSSYSQVILLCHYLFPSEAVQSVFRDRVGLLGIRCFRFIIRRAERVEVPPGLLSELFKETEFELTKNLSDGYELGEKQGAKLIDKLIKCATCHYADYRYPDDESSYDLYLDYFMDDEGELRKAFRYHFGEGAEDGTDDKVSAKSALNLFHSLQVLLTLNGYQASDEVKASLYHSNSLYSPETLPTPASHDRIFRIKDFEIMKKGVNETIYGRALSDGEHQLIHTIGLCLLFRHEPALFLLDEPETHLNPDWRASYISTLRAALDADESAKSVMREVLLTSHSPFVISDCQQENVLIFKKDEANRVTCTRPNFQTFGASANAITIKVFGQTETIGDYAMTKLDELRQRLDQGEDSDTLIEEANRILGDSVEKVLFINEALNRKEGK